MIEIKELAKDNLETFFKYLAEQLAENGGTGASIFQPLSSSQSKLSDELKEKFKKGISKNFDENGWRKIWVVMTPDLKIVGHVDIRP